jgi:hypothetical protein
LLFSLPANAFDLFFKGKFFLFHRCLVYFIGSMTKP